MDKKSSNINAPGPEVPDIDEKITRESIEAFMEIAVCEFLPPGNKSKYSKTTPLMELGLVSLQLMELRAALCKKYTLELQPTFFFEFGTADAAIKYIIQRKLEIFKDWLYEIAWRPTPISESMPFIRDRLWIILSNESPLSEQLNKTLQENSQSCINVKAGKVFEKLGSQNFVVNPRDPKDFSRLLAEIPGLNSLAGVINLWSYAGLQSEPTLSTIDEYLRTQCEGLINLANALALTHLPDYSRLWIVNTSIPDDGTKTNLVQTPYDALCKVIQEEYPKSQCTHLALDATLSVEDCVAAIISELNGGAQFEPDIAYRGGQRLVARLVPGEIKKFLRPAFSPLGSYMISGGLQPLGLRVARWYIEHGAKTIILLDETDVTPKIQGDLDLLKALGANVVTFKAMFDDQANLARIFESIKNDLPPLKGLIHSAGVLHQDLLMHVNWESSKHLRRLKIAGSWNLHELTQNLALDHFVLFSTSLKDLAPFGKASLTIGNAFLNALSHYRHKQGLPALSIDWAPWQASQMLGKHLPDQTLGSVMRVLSVYEGLIILDDLFHVDKPQIMATEVQWEALFHRATSDNPLFDEIAVALGIQKSKLETLAPVSQSRTDEPIAIIGMACRFPGAKNYREFWENLVNQVDSVIEIPPDRWDWKEIYGDPKTEPGKTNVKWGGFIDDVDKFDPLFFNISPKEAAYIDPQHRLFLQTVWHAMEDAGYTSDMIAGQNIGVYAGVSKNDYAELMRENNVEIAPYISTGTVHSILTNRVSYILDLHGPSESIDTACSSALVALHSAIRDLRNGECKLAFVGGVNALISPTMYLSHTRSGMLSADGHCKTFDEGANGYVRGEGVGVILLKPLKDALRDGDDIHAVIRGAAINHGGKSSGLTAPNVDAQADVVRAALSDARVDSTTITCIEVHGTGTPLGDPIEIDGLKKAFASNDTQKHCVLSAVKTNIGHLESAAGIAGLIKMVLELKHHAIPANIHFKTLNPRIILEGSPFSIAQNFQEWNPLDQYNRPMIRRGGVSSFGMGGANGHVILEEAPHKLVVTEFLTSLEFPLSARKGRLKAYIEELNKYLIWAIDKKIPIDLESLAYTLQTGRNAFDERIVFMANSVAELSDKLSRVADNTATLSETATRWVKGDKVDWNANWKARPQRWSGIPGYPFQPLRCWFEARARAQVIEAMPPSERDFQSTLFFLKDHIVAGKSILPGVMYLELARAATGRNVAAIRNVNWISPIEATRDSIHVSVQLDGNHFKIVEGVIIRCTGDLVFDQNDIAPEPVDIQRLVDACPHKKNHREIYSKMQELGLKQGPSLRVLTEFHSGPSIAIGRLRLNPSEDLKAFTLHPSLMDGVFQTVVAHYFSEHLDATQQYLPFALESVTWFRPLESEVYAYVEELKTTGTGNILKYRMKMLTLKGDVIVQFEGFARRPIRQEAAPTLKDIYYVDRWDTKDAVQNRQPSNTVLLFSADEQLKEALRIELPGTSVISVSIGSHFEVCSDDRYLVNPGQINDFHALMNDLKDREVVIRDIVYAWDSFELLPILFLTQALMKSRNFQDLLLLYVYTRSSELVSAEYAMAAGFGRTLIYENPKMEVRSVETSRIAADERAHIIASELHTSARGPLLEVSYIDGSRKVRAVVPAPDLEKYIPKSMPFKLGGTYLITGGTGGLGHIFAKYLVDHYKANLILVGRSELNDSIKKNIDVLQASGSRVHYISADVTDARALQKAFRTLPEELQSLNGVIHAAGLKKDSYILKKDEASFNQVILTKVKGALSLDALTKDMKLDFMVLFSSVAALIPNQGQSDYAAANSFLDRFAQMRNKLRSGFTLAIGWPLWASGGMSVTSEQEEHLKRVFGMDPLPSEIGIKVFEHLLGYASENKVDQVIVISGDKDKIMTAFNGTSVEAVETAPDAEYPLVDSVQQDGIHSVALKEFTPNLAYVNGFSHQGKAAVPGACFLEMARQAAEKLSGEKKYVCINNNYWPVPLEIEGGKAVAKTRFTHFPDHVDFEISTTGLNQKEIVHATGTLATKERYLAKPQAIDLTKKMATATQVLKSDAFYETIHSNANLRLSGNFRPVQELYVFDMEAIARLVLPTTGTPRGNFLIKPIIFTGLEQALLVYTAITHGRFHPGGMRLMPVSIESVNVYAPFPDSCWVHISAKKEPSAANKIQRFDVTLYDDSGSIVAFVSGNTMRISPLENAAESKAIAVPAPSGNAEKYIKKILSEVLGIKEEDIDSSTDFERYGVTSQMIVELNTLMENDLGPVSKTLFFEFANVNELAAHLNGQYKDKFSAPILTPTAKEELTLIIREAADSDIAIIGMSGRFPEASSLSEYWNNLVAGRDSVTKGPLHQDLYQSELIERENFLAKWGGSIKDVEQFDPEFFGIAPKEGSLIDPQERLFLKVAWEALQDAGIDPKELDDEQRLIGVYVGALWQDYQHIALEESLKGQAVTVSSQLYSIANRVSYTFNFNGPSLAVDTACSSSLTALHLACQSLISGDSTAAIVGGVNLNLHPTKYAFLNHYNFLSSEGKCRSYGEGGDGYVPGEGIGALILKPLKDALRDGDPVHAVIKSSAINHGGKTRGYTVPNPALQSAVVLRAIKRANINPRDISYVEGHGTGTALGDPIEIRGLDLAYSQFTDEKKFCAIGSVKSNIGHLEAAAGVASVIKVVLQMAHRMLAPSLHSETLNKNIDFDASAFYVQRKLEPWVSKGPLLAAVSSFGAGGSYAHVIIEEAPSSEGLSGKRNPPALFSGKEEKYWIEGQAKKPESKAIQNPLLGERLSHSKDDAFQGELNLSTLSYLKDHQVFDTLIYPGSAYVEMILAAAVSGNGKTSVRVTDVSFESPLKFESGGNVATQTLTEPVDAGNRVSIYSQKDDGLWIAHARGTVTAAPISNDHLFIDIAALKERSTTKLDKTDFYRYVHSTGLNLGPLFQTVEAIYVGDKESFGEIKVSGNVQGYIAHPSLLDGCLQTLYASLWHDKESTLHLPIGFDTLELYAPLGNHVFAHWQEKDVSASGRSGDVTIYGPSGEILASIKGFHFRKTSERAVKQMLASESSIDDWFYEWTWKDQPLDDVKSSASLGYWLVIGDGPIVDRIQDNLRSRGEKFTTFPTSEVPKTKEGFAALLQTQQYAVIVHASGTTEGSEEITHDAIERAQEACCRSFLYLCQALTPMPDSTRPQVLLARSSSPIFATVDGLYKTVTLEHPELNLKQLILKEGWEPQHLVNAAYLPQTSTVLTLTKSRCLVGLLSKPEGRQEKPPEVNFQRDATYLITGGLGGLGISLAAWLADRMAGHIVIVGRRPSDENLLKSMERPDTRFSYVQCDISNERAVSDLISQLGESKNPLKGIFHLAGILDDATIMEQVWSRFNKVFASKLYGTYYLHKYAKDLDYFVLFSSIASTLGNPGQGNYAAANAFMDALCEFRKEKGLPGLSISWGPWAEIGMAKELTARHARSGWIGMKPDEAMRALEKALVMGVAHPTIAKIIWGDVLSNMSSPPEWLQNFREQGASHHEGIQLQDMLVGEREERIRQLVGEVLRACLGMASSQPIDPGKSFFEMGLDSLMVVEMRNRLQTELGSQVTLSTSTIFDHGSLAELSLYINSLLEGGKRSEVKETKLNRPTELIPHVKPLEIPELPILVAPFPPKTILVTGATGFLGAFLLKLLAEEFKDSKFYCLVRAENDSRAKERILDNLNRYRIDSSAYAHRITAIASDLLLPRFGIADSRYMELAAEVDMVVNSAAFLNWAFSYHALETFNVDSVREILTFATLHKVKDVHHISTIGVFPRTLGANQEIDEDLDLMFDGDISNNGISHGYFQSKWAAEVLVYEARKKGLKINLYRPSSLIGDSQYGIPSFDEFSCRMVEGCRQLGVAPENDTLLDIVPVDFAAEAIVRIIAKGHPRNENFNIINKNPISIRSLFAGLQEVGEPLKIIPRAEWDSLVSLTVTESPAHPLAGIISIIPGYLALTSPNYSCKNTLVALEGKRDITYIDANKLIRTFINGILDDAKKK